MKLVILTIAVGGLLIGWALRLGAKRNPSLNKGWSVLAFTVTTAALAIGGAIKTTAAMDADWWRAAGFGLLTLVGLVSSALMLRPKS
jgi:hypothetical protein